MKRKGRWFHDKRPRLSRETLSQYETSSGVRGISSCLGSDNCLLHPLRLDRHCITTRDYLHINIHIVSSRVLVANEEVSRRCCERCIQLPKLLSWYSWACSDSSYQKVDTAWCSGSWRQQQRLGGWKFECCHLQYYSLVAFWVPCWQQKSAGNE